MKKLALILLTPLLLQSCATVLQGSRQRVTITAEPEYAQIYVDEKFIWNGRVSTKLKRSKSHSIMIKHEGYETRHIQLTPQIQPGWIITDIIFGFFPMLVDALTGAYNKLDNPTHHIQLEKKK